MYKIKINVYSLLMMMVLFSACGEEFNRLQKEDNVYALTTEHQLKNEDSTKKIEEFYVQGKEGSFVGQANIDIYYKIFKQSALNSPAILISSGRTEAAIKYKELIFDLYNNGYSVYILDHRGQGLSGRMDPDPEMGYIDVFQYYIDDVKQFYTKMILPNHQNIYLLAHSMGGAIGVTYIEQYPHDFKAAAFSSPMLGLQLGICEGAKLLEKDKPEYGLGEGKYKDNVLAFNENKLTGSEIRYNRMNAAFKSEPRAKLGGASYDWVVLSCQQFDIMNKDIDHIQTPFILFSAENEQIVNTDAHKIFVEKAKRLGKVCEAYLVENAQHELLIEKDAQRILVINNILRYFEKNPKSKH